MLWLCSVVVADHSSDDGLNLLQLRADNVGGLANCKFIDAEVTQAEYNRKETYATEDEAIMACQNNAKCKGIWLMKKTNRWLPLYPGGRTWRTGVPNWTVLAVKQCATCAFAEAEVTRGEYRGKDSYATEEEAITACLADATCKGIWLMKRTNRWFPLYPGGRTWKKGVPNHTVLSAKKCVACTFAEAEVTRGEYRGNDSYATENEAITACKEDAKCKGIWLMKRTNRWFPLRAGRRTWRKGVPNHTVLSVKRCVA